MPNLAWKSSTENKTKQIHIFIEFEHIQLSYFAKKSQHIVLRTELPVLKLTLFSVQNSESGMVHLQFAWDNLSYASMSIMDGNKS